MIITEKVIKNGNALNDAKDDPNTRGYKLSCLISAESGIEVLYGVDISYINVELDNFMLLILYPNGKYKIIGTFQYQDLNTEKIENYVNTIFSELKDELDVREIEDIFSLLCGIVHQIQYVRNKVNQMTNSQLISAKDAAKLYGISCDAARAFIKSNGGTKHGREWMLQREVFEQKF